MLYISSVVATCGAHTIGVARPTGWLVRENNIGNRGKHKKKKKGIKISTHKKKTKL
jgi:hypothetical protein